MKKLTKVLALILCMAMAFALCACGATDQEKFVGTWKAEADVTEDIMTGLESQLGDAIVYFDFGKIMATMTFVFNEDGTYTADVKLSDESVDQFYDALKEGMSALMDDTLADELESYGMTKEEYEAVYLELYGTSYQDDVAAYIESVMEEIDIQAMFGDQATEGKWKVEEGKLLLTDDPDAEFNAGSYEIYENLTENSFTLVCGYTNGDKDAEDMYPLSFVKVG